MQETRLGPYTLLAELGSGGMGTVWKAAAPDGAAVALKVVHEHVAATPGFLERFLREGEVGKSVRHENVVETLATGEDRCENGVRHWIALEYVEGQTLRALADEMGTVPEELCRHVGREIAKGLAALHAAGLVHRDMKPENVLITRDHVVKVMDLGIAREADDVQRMTATGMFIGSVQYAAPEQFTGGGRGLDARADLHALGVTLYELATGVQPFEAEDVSTTLRNVLQTVPRLAGEVNPQLSAFFEEVLRTLLEKDRERRFASAEQLLGVLEAGEDSAWWRERARSIQSEAKRPIRRIRIPRETAVYGREEEIGRLRALYAAAKAGDGRVVLIEGEAGIGKSRLVDELVVRLQAGGEDLNFLFGSYPPGGAATAAGGFSSAFREQFGEGGSAAYLPENRVLVPAFDALLRGEVASAGAHALTPESLRTCFVRAAQALAAERTTVVLIDDLHFAPEEGRALFSSLAMAVPGHRLLLIGSTRPGIAQDWRAGLTRLSHVSPLPLQRLGPKDLVHLLADSLHSQHLAEDLGGRIALKSDGNPFFAFEIIRGLREGQFITQRKDGTWATTRVIEEIEIPSSVRDLVNARVSGLRQDERDVLDIAACCGYEFDPSLVAEVTGLGRLPILKKLAQVERAHRLVRASGRNFVFDHHQVQEALYGSLPEMLREEYHAALAQALEARAKAAEQDPSVLGGALCVDLCEHFLRGARGESAIRYLGAALSHLEGGYLSEAAIHLADRALAVPGLVTGTARCSVLLRKAGCCRILGRPVEWRGALDEALALADASGDAVLRAAARRALGAHLSFVGRHAEAETALIAARDLARAAGDLREEAVATGSLAVTVGKLARFADAEALHERYLALLRELGDRRAEASGTGSLGMVHQALGRLDEAKACFSRQLQIAREFGDRREQGQANGHMGTALGSAGSFAEAQPYFEASLEASREIGERRLEALATGSLGIISLHFGRADEAEARFERSLALAREIGERDVEGYALGHLGTVAAYLGRPADSQGHHQRYLLLARTTGNRQEEGFALYGLAAAADDLGDPATARRAAEEALRVRRDIRHQHGIVASLVQLAGICRRAGDTDAARAAVDEVLALAGSQRMAGSFALCQALSGALSGEEPTAALAALEDASQGIRDDDAAETLFLAWQTTHARAHLEAAKRRVDGILAKAPAAARDDMRRNVRVLRDVLTAWRAEFGDGSEEPAVGSSARDG